MTSGKELGFPIRWSFPEMDVKGVQALLKLDPGLGEVLANEEPIYRI